jgi:hypothetical protein
MFSSFENIVDLGKFKNTFFFIYNFAIDFVLAIKCSFLTPIGPVQVPLDLYSRALHVSVAVQ